MASLGSSPVFLPPIEKNYAFLKTISVFPNLGIPKSTKNIQKIRIRCGISETGLEKKSKNRMEEYNTAMKRMMMSPYEYHHDLGMNYTLILDNLIVGSQPQKAEDIDHLKQEENVAYILNLQQDSDIEYWGIDFESVLKRCKEVSIRHMRRLLNKAYEEHTSKRPCGPNKNVIRGATYDLAKNDAGNKSLESLPENAFEGIAGWERKLI